jgi:hypothetical protein
MRPALQQLQGLDLVALAALKASREEIEHLDTARRRPREVGEGFVHVASV